MGTNSKIPSKDIIPLPFRYFSKVPEDTHATFYNSASFGRDSGKLDKTLTHEQFLTAQLHAFLHQDSPNPTQINDAKNKPVVEIINIPKSSTIRVLHSFVVGTNRIGGSSLIAGNI